MSNDLGRLAMTFQDGYFRVQYKGVEYLNKNNYFLFLPLKALLINVKKMS